MTSKRAWPILAIIIGSILSIIGGLFVAAYILEAIVKRAGEPDQSLLFWYLPFLFVGLIGVIIGIVSSGWGIIRLKKI
jgi:MFS family permease